MPEEITPEVENQEPEEKVTEVTPQEDQDSPELTDLEVLAQEIAKLRAERDSAVTELESLRRTPVDEAAQKREQQIKEMLEGFSGRSGRTPTGEVAPAPKPEGAPQSDKDRTAWLLSLSGKDFAPNKSK